MLDHSTRLSVRHLEVRRRVEHQHTRARLRQHLTQHGDALKVRHRAAAGLERERARLVEHHQPECLVLELERRLEAAVDHLERRQGFRRVVIEVARRPHV